MSEAIDQGRRRLLTTATAVTGAVGAGFAAVPFFASWLPSERAKALGAPVDIDIGQLEPGAMLKVEWRGKPVYVVHRTPAMLEEIKQARRFLLDPASDASVQPPYARNDTRSIEPQFFVVLGVCTHLGCAPLAKFQPDDTSVAADWPGGFYCPCHGSKFDLAGRVFKGVPAPSNLAVPPYRFLSASRIQVGTDASPPA